MQTETEVNKLFERTNGLRLDTLAPELYEPINQFRIPARKYRQGDEQALSLARLHYSGALAAVEWAEAAVETGSGGTTSTSEAPLPSGHGAVIGVPVHSVVPHPKNPRLAVKPEVLEALKESMKAAGFDPARPLLVRTLENGYQVIDGHTRLLAAKEVGLEQVYVVVWDASEAEVQMKLATANVQAPLTFLEHGLHSLSMEEQGVTVKAYAQSLGIRPENLSKYRRAAEVFHYLQPGLSTYDVTVLRTKAEHLSAIGAVSSEKWHELARAIVDDKLSVRKVQALVRGRGGESAKPGPTGRSTDKGNLAAEVEARTLPEPPTRAATSAAVEQPASKPGPVKAQTKDFVAPPKGTPSVSVTEIVKRITAIQSIDGWASTLLPNALALKAVIESGTMTNAEAKLVDAVLAADTALTELVEFDADKLGRLVLWASGLLEAKPGKVA